MRFKSYKNKNGVYTKPEQIADKFYIFLVT